MGVGAVQSLSTFGDKQVSVYEPIFSCTGENLLRQLGPIEHFKLCFFNNYFLEVFSVFEMFCCPCLFQICRHMTNMFVSLI